MLGGDRRARLRRTVLVTGRDGYTAVLALAEIDPEFEGTPRRFHPAAFETRNHSLRRVRSVGKLFLCEPCMRPSLNHRSCQRIPPA